MRQESEDTTITYNVVYNVVINHEEQYSIWPAERDNPLGWRNAGFRGTKDECLSYIEQVWTDMRPLSVRQEMAKASREIPGMAGETSASQRIP